MAKIITNTQLKELTKKVDEALIDQLTSLIFEHGKPMGLDNRTLYSISGNLELIFDAAYYNELEGEEID